MALRCKPKAPREFRSRWKAPPQIGVEPPSLRLTADPNWRRVRRLRFSFPWYGEYLSRELFAHDTGASRLAVRLSRQPTPGPETRHAAPFRIDPRNRCQSRGEPESRGIMPTNRASVIVKSSCRFRRYARAASSDS